MVTGKTGWQVQPLLNRQAFTNSLNESGADAYVLPIQDAGLHTYLRSLDIAFSK